MTQILAAERRLVDAAGVTDRHRANPDAVEMALLEQAANGTTLNPGQAALVTQMASSGARVQLAIAPAGAGKTTAMRALAAAWVEDGGTVIGLAPVRRRRRDPARADRRRHRHPGQAHLVNQHRRPARLGLARSAHEPWSSIDEAGMADTLSLDTAVAFVTARGGQVRLIGDNQQLAAIGAGGVLRDIAATHGALHLSELMRFTDPVEGAASLALRDGRTEALGYYLDHDRVHVGDLATITQRRVHRLGQRPAQGLDALMLAPTRDLVSQLNQQAQTHRLAGRNPGPGVRLADGNTALAGDSVVTRTNDRRLRLGVNDWVKNGDRWTVHDVHRDGSLAVQHRRTGRSVTLPADYVTAAAELGYASTIHGAQGISVDTVHGLATGDETRQQLYTMLTRGADANHLYLQVIGDGDPHDLLQPQNVRPPTATDILEAHPGPRRRPRLGHHHRPRPRLPHPAARRRRRPLPRRPPRRRRTPPRPRRHAALEAGADRLVPGIADDPAWPTLRAHLVLLAATGDDPLTALHFAAGSRELDSADDRAAVLDWRLDDHPTAGRDHSPGSPASRPAPR